MISPIMLHDLRLKNGAYDVPCDGCTKCCHNDAVRILPHEDASRWQYEPHPYMIGALVLAHKPNGDCVYLGERGCTRQDDKPQMCHEMDCRLIAQRMTKAQAKRLHDQGLMRMGIWERGQELLALAGNSGAECGR